MGFAGFGTSQLSYDMFDLERSADEAARFARCERIYHRGQALAWDGKEILPMLLEKHGGIHIDPARKEALERIFTIILWGELAAWRISAQLADRLEPLEAKMAATSQAHDEARHFYVMYDYLRALGCTPKRLDRAPQALLELVLETPHLAHKLLGMQLMIETLALTIFQTVRELEVEPVLSDLMRYFERDEARHVGLGMQYLPQLMAEMSRVDITRLMFFQLRVLFWGVWEAKILEPDLETLGASAREVLERGRLKQVTVMREAFEVVGFPVDDNPMLSGLNAVAELMFPLEGARRPAQRLRAAWTALRGGQPAGDPEAMAIHARHEILTARGEVAPAESVRSTP